MGGASGTNGGKRNSYKVWGGGNLRERITWRT